MLGDPCCPQAQGDRCDRRSVRPLHPAGRPRSHPVCAENSDSDVLVMQTADQGMRRDASDPLNWTREWRILGQRPVRSYGVVITLRAGQVASVYGHLQVHDPAPRAAIADLANIPAQPCGSYRSDRSVRGSNADIRVPVCVSHVGPRSTTAALVRGDAAPDRRVAGAADLGGVPVERGADLFGARQ
jgi:hypothetical protein